MNRRGLFSFLGGAAASVAAAKAGMLDLNEIAKPQVVADVPVSFEVEAANFRIVSADGRQVFNIRDGEFVIAV